MKAEKEQKHHTLNQAPVHRRKLLTAYLSKRQRSVKEFLPKKSQTFLVSFLIVHKNQGTKESYKFANLGDK